MARAITDVNRPTLHVTLMLIASFIGFWINVIVYPDVTTLGALLALGLYAIVGAAGIATWLVPSLRKRSRTMAGALAYPVVFVDVYGSALSGGGQMALWMLITPTLVAAAVSIFARRWWEAIPIGIAVILTHLFCWSAGLVDSGDTAALIFCHVLVTVFVTIATAARVRTEARLKRLNAQLSASRAEAEEAVQAKSQFLATMSHEIRTPLNGVVGMADLLADADLSPDHADCVRTIRSSADTLLVVVNDVLDFSKIEAGGVALERVAFDPQRVGREAARIVESAAKAKDLSLSVERDDGVPDYVLGDATRVRQVLLNLLSNAIKFTHRGGVSVRLSYEPDGDRLRFDVTDTGIGIAPDAVGGVFESFTQADASTTRLYGGTGLGLAISRRLARLMGGDVEVESELGHGTTFSLVVRAERVEMDSEEMASPSIVPLIGEVRVLVVEDNAVNRKVVVRLLERLGLSADIAVDGVEAVEALHSAANVRSAYDVVLMDVEMPRLNGHDATRRLRAELPPDAQPYVIALTAHTDEQSRAASKAAGCDAHLGKPIRLGALEQALQSAGVGPTVAQP